MEKKNNNMENLPVLTYEWTTPDDAENYLMKNPSNRTLSWSRIRTYAKSMEEGKWRHDNGESIKIDADGNLIDGQHRLEAIKLINKPILLAVMRNLPADSRITIDTGKKRSGSDALRMYGHTYRTSTVAATLRLIHKEKKGTLHTNTGESLTNEEILNLLKEHPNLENSLRDLNKIIKKGNMPSILPTSVALLLFYMWHSAYPRETEDFFTKLFVGIGLMPNTGVFHLRNRLIRATAALKRVDRLDHEEKIALTIKAFKKDLKHETVKSLNYSKNNEPFPSVRKILTT